MRINLQALAFLIVATFTAAACRAQESDMTEGSKTQDLGDCPAYNLNHTKELFEFVGTITGYSDLALESFNGKPGDGANYAGTHLEISCPREHAKVMFNIHHSRPSEIDSRWRENRKKVRFQIERSRFEDVLNSEKTGDLVIVHAFELKGMKWID